MRPVKLVPDSTNIAFLNYRWWALAISIILLLAAVALVAVDRRRRRAAVEAIGGLILLGGNRSASLFNSLST